MSGKREKETELKQKIELRLDKAPGILRIYKNNLIDSGKSYDTAYRYINYILQFIKYTFGDNWNEKFYREVKPIHITEYIASMKTNSANTVSDSITGAHWSALNSFFGFLVGDYIESNPVSATQRPKNNDKPQLTYLTHEEIAGLLENVKKTAQTRFVNRDLCILKLGFSTGMSVGTIVQLDIEDINFEKNQIRTTKKNHNDQYVMFGKNLKSQLLARLSDRSTYFGNSTSSALFVSQYGTRISDDSIGRLLKKYAKGITDKPIHPHVMRNSCVTNLYKKQLIFICVQSS